MPRSIASSHRAIAPLLYIPCRSAVTHLPLPSRLFAIGAQQFHTSLTRMSQFQKEVTVSKGPSVHIDTQAAIPRAGPNDVVIKNVVVGTNPKDWKYPEYFGKAFNSGDDVAGTIHEVGENVVEFHVGDRVAGFHRMREPHGAFAEYTLVPADTTFHLPKKTSYEEAATIPLAALTAAVGLFQRLDLPHAWSGNRQDGQPRDPNTKAAVPTASPDLGPLIIWGGATAVGAFAIKLAKRVTAGPIIAIAGRGIPFVESLLDKSAGDTVIDYRQDEDKIVAAIKQAAGGKAITRAFDTISEHGSYQTIAKVLANGAKLATVLPGRSFDDIPSHVEHSSTYVADVHRQAQDQTDLGFVWSRLFTKGLQEGWFSGHPYEVVPGGLGGVEQGLKGLKEGKNSGSKYVYRIEETK